MHGGGSVQAQRPLVLSITPDMARSIIYHGLHKNQDEFFNRIVWSLWLYTRQAYPALTIEQIAERVRKMANGKNVRKLKSDPR